MAKHSSLSYFAPEPPQYRVVVRASGSTRRSFIWEIVHSDVTGNTSVKRASAQLFRTMEEAYSNGAATLAGLPKRRPIRSAHTDPPPVKNRRSRAPSRS